MSAQEMKVDVPGMEELLRRAGDEIRVRADGEQVTGQCQAVVLDIRRAMADSDALLRCREQSGSPRGRCDRGRRGLRARAPPRTPRRAARRARGATQPACRATRTPPRPSPRRAEVGRAREAWDARKNGLRARRERGTKDDERDERENDSRMSRIFDLPGPRGRHAASGRSRRVQYTEAVQLWVGSHAGTRRAVWDVARRGSVRLETPGPSTNVR